MSGCFGRAEAAGHAGELLQGAIRFGGLIEPFLITLPAPWLRSRAEIADAEAWSVEPVWKPKALNAARLAALEFGWTGSASLRVHSAIPVARGYGSSAAALAASRLQPAVLDYLFFAHASAEPAHRAMLASMGVEPVLGLGMRLGEGSGAALLFPILDAARALYTSMATFEEASVNAAL